MPPRTTKQAPPKGPVRQQARVALAALKQLSTQHDRRNLTRFGITANKAFGVSMANIQKVAKRLGKNHELAAALWDSGWYEARMLAAFVDQPARVTPGQMDRWAKDFDNWGICDTVCFVLFDRTPHAWKKVAQWSDQRGEFVKRAAYALLWGLTVHDKHADDRPFTRGLLLIERAAHDERHWVKKAVNMALRAVGKRSVALNAAARSVARRLADSTAPAPRWVGKDALRELAGPKVQAALARRPGD